MSIAMTPAQLSWMYQEQKKTKSGKKPPEKPGPAKQSENASLLSKLLRRLAEMEKNAGA